MFEKIDVGQPDIAVFPRNPGFVIRIENLVQYWWQWVRHCQFKTGTRKQNATLVISWWLSSPEWLKLARRGWFNEDDVAQIECWRFTEILNLKFHRPGFWPYVSTRWSSTYPSSLVKGKVGIGVSPQKERDSRINYASYDPRSFHPFPYDGFVCVLMGAVGIFWRFWTSRLSRPESRLVLAGIVVFAYGCFRLLWWMPRF
jgi:hypothetical protein